MERQANRVTSVDEMLRACAEHSWNNENGNFRHRRQFESIGIKSPEELREALRKGLKDKGTRSFDRQPNDDLKQTEKSIIYQAKLIDRQDREHQITVILNPDRDDMGNLHGGTAYLNDPKRRPDIHRHYEMERQRGNEPKFLLRGENLSLTAELAIKTPGQRLAVSPPQPEQVKAPAPIDRLEEAKRFQAERIREIRRSPPKRDRELDRDDLER